MYKPGWGALTFLLQHFCISCFAISMYYFFKDNKNKFFFSEREKRHNLTVFKGRIESIIKMSCNKKVKYYEI